VSFSWSKGIPGKPAKSGIRGEWIQSLAAVLAQAFLTSIDSQGVSPPTSLREGWMVAKRVTRLINAIGILQQGTILIPCRPE
jgi:hypothetical protein